MADSKDDALVRIAKGSRIVVEVQATDVSVFFRRKGDRCTVYVKCAIEAYDGTDAEQLARNKINEIGISNARPADCDT